ncbi:MAG TPA: putative PEP-binding protein [Gemmataceae bacterium]|nr:putative PEP-binding protein [Gemmataceae bacterium]
MTQTGTSHESSLLLTLEEISQLVAQSHDPGETLENIVRLIQGRCHTDVCSVYLFEPERAELVLGATIGLKPEGVGRVRMRPDEGLTGLVAERMTPVAVADAPQHPRFKYFPEAGEDPYHSFLGVPLVEGGELQGVLVVQTVEPRTFSPGEVRMLLTVASQLAPLVSDARLLERVVAAAHQESGARPACLRGTPLSPGVGLGQAYVVDDFESWRAGAADHGADPAAERQRLARAMEEAREEIGRLSQHISVLVGEDHGAILQAQLMILQDRVIEQDLTDCLAAGCTAEAALLQTLDKYVAAFQKLATPFFQERVYDVKDVFRRILWHLRPAGTAPDAAGQRLVLVAREASVMDLFSVDLADLAAVVVEHGGPQSHAAILARSLGVPMVGQVTDLAAARRPGLRLLVNGTTGKVYLEPTPEMVAAQQATDRRPRWGVVSRPRPNGGEALPREAATSGRPQVEVNINLMCEVGEALAQQAVGVGLFRSEFLFLARRTLPGEEEQVDTYRKLLTQLGGRPATIRTFDLRPDKLAHGDHLATAVGHTLDWRQVLTQPPLQKLFKDQVRAILRAATAGPARILVPLITRTELLDFVLRTVQQAREELRREGLEFGREVPLGIMLESAGAALMVETWLDQVDFVALGTNDLLASALGLSRDDPVGSSPGDLLHPGLLRIIDHVVEAAHGAGRPVTVCGEMAADPDGIVALAALDVDVLSVPVNQLGPTRQVLAARPGRRLTSLTGQMLRLRSAEQVRRLLRE